MCRPTSRSSAAAATAAETVAAVAAARTRQEQPEAAVPSTLTATQRLRDGRKTATPLVGAEASAWTDDVETGNDGRDCRRKAVMSTAVAAPNGVYYSDVNEAAAAAEFLQLHDDDNTNSRRLHRKLPPPPPPPARRDTNISSSR